MRFTTSLCLTVATLGTVTLAGRSIEDILEGITLDAGFNLVAGKVGRYVTNTRSRQSVKTGTRYQYAINLLQKRVKKEGHSKAQLTRPYNVTRDLELKRFQHVTVISTTGGVRTITLDNPDGVQAKPAVEYRVGTADWTRHFEPLSRHQIEIDAMNETLVHVRPSLPIKRPITKLSTAVTVLCQWLNSGDYYDIRRIDLIVKSLRRRINYRQNQGQNRVSFGHRLAANAVTSVKNTAGFLAVADEVNFAAAEMDAVTLSSANDRLQEVENLMPEAFKAAGIPVRGGQNAANKQI